MDSTKKLKTEKEITNYFLQETINTLYGIGFLRDSDLNNSTLLKKKVLKFLDDPNIELSFITDHRKTIIELAEQEYINDNKELSITLYATFIEHTINKIIHLECTKKSIDDKTTNDIIKNINLSGKCTWLLKLLGLPEIKTNYISTIKRISDERNAFIHYKWKAENESNDNEAKTKQKDSDKFNSIKSLLKYLKTYESRLQYNGNKGRINKLVKK